MQRSLLSLLFRVQVTGETGTKKIILTPPALTARTIGFAQEKHSDENILSCKPEPSPENEGLGIGFKFYKKLL